MANSTKAFKCRKCRQFLFGENIISDCHGNPLLNVDVNRTDPRSNVWYLREDMIPIWIKKQLDYYDWTKGKILCPKCCGRIGSFNFIGDSKGSSVPQGLPSVHFVASKLDFEEQKEELVTPTASIKPIGPI